MRKFTFLLSALCLLSAACQKTEWAEAPETVELTRIHATAAPETRTILSAETKVLWLPDDYIHVFNANGSAIFTCDLQEAAAVADFTGTLEADPSDPTIWALYGGGDAVERTDDGIKTWLQPTQQAREGTFANNLLLTMGQSQGNAITFQHICGGICFTVQESGITSLTVTANRYEPVAGGFVASFGNDGNPVAYPLEEEAVSTVTLNAPNGFVPGEKYFIVLLPGTLKQGLTFRFQKTDGTFGTRTIDKSVTIKRGIFSRLLNADEGVQFSTGKTPTLTCVTAQETGKIEVPVLRYKPLSFTGAGATRKDHTNLNGIPDERAARSTTIKETQPVVSLLFKLEDCDEVLETVTADNVYFNNLYGGIGTSVVTATIVGSNTIQVVASVEFNPADEGDAVLSVRLPSGKIVESEAFTLSASYFDADYMRIASQEEDNAYNYHYRRAEVGINNPDEEARKPAADANYVLSTIPVTEYSANPEVNLSTTDAKLVYDGSLNLMDLVRVDMGQQSLLADELLNTLGLKWQFEVVHYGIGSPAILQEYFVTLSQTTSVTPGTRVTATPRAYGYTNTRAAIGAIPIIRVSLLDGNNIVECAYIKLYIADEDSWTRKSISIIDVQFDFNADFNCYQDHLSFYTTVNQMSDAFYTAADMPPYQFHSAYTFKAYTGGYGTVSLVETGNGACVLKWEVSMDEIWQVASASPYNGTMTKSIEFRYGQEVEGFIVKFNANVSQFSSTWDIFKDGKGQYSPQYWYDDNGHIDNDNFGHTRFTSAIPVYEETGDEFCVFENSLDNPFMTDESGSISLQYKTGMRFSNLAFYFHPDNKNLTIGGIKLEVDSQDPTLLHAKKGSQNQIVARIYNDGYGVYGGSYSADDIILPHAIVLDKTKSLAKELVNAGVDAFKVYIGLKANICGDQTKVINIDFNGKPYFEGRFIRPIAFGTESQSAFADGVDAGEHGSYIRLDNLLPITDWRERSFSEHDNYWTYYGIGSFSIVSGSLKCNIYSPESNTGTYDLPNGVYVYLSGNKTGSSSASSVDRYGYLIYHNNGMLITHNYIIFLKMNVNYTWGTATTEEITIPVNPL